MARCKLSADQCYTPNGDTNISIQRAVNPEICGFDLLIQRGKSATYKKFFQRIANVQQALRVIKAQLEDPKSLPLNSPFSFKVVTLDSIAISKDHIRIGVQSCSSGLFGMSQRIREVISNQVLKHKGIFSGVLGDIELPQEELEKVFDWKKEGKSTVIYVNFFLADVIIERIFSFDKDEIPLGNDINRISSLRQSIMKNNGLVESIVVEKDSICEDVDIDEQKDTGISIKIIQLRHSSRLNQNNLAFKNEIKMRESAPRMGMNQLVPKDDISISESTATFISLTKSSIVGKTHPMDFSFAPVQQATGLSELNQHEDNIFGRESIFSEAESIIIEKHPSLIAKHPTDDPSHQLSRIEIISSSKSDGNQQTSLKNPKFKRADESYLNNSKKEMLNRELDAMGFSMTESIVVSKNNSLKNSEIQAPDTSEKQRSSIRLIDHPLVKEMITPGYE